MMELENASLTASQRLLIKEELNKDLQGLEDGAIDRWSD